VTVAFDFYTMLSWDGDNYGPDIFQLSLGSGETLLRSSFALYPGPTQSFPREHGGATYPARHAADENDTLGYVWGSTPMDAVWHIVATISHTADSLVLDFAGLNLQGVSDEAWGLDNVRVDVALQEPPPDVTVTAATAPATADWGQLIPVAWTVQNTADYAARGRWADQVYLSTDNQLDATDIRLLTHDAAWVSPLAAHGSYTTQAQYVTIPATLAGDLFLLFAADANAQQVETDETNNTRAVPLRVRGADLAVPIVTAPGAALTGETLRVTWRVDNVGQAATTVGSWSDRVYLSADDTFGNDTLLATVAHTGALAAGGSYGQVADVRLSPTLTAGTYWILVETDGLQEVAEVVPGAANVGRSPTATQVGLAPVPDLRVSDAQAGASAVIGQPYAVTWTANSPTRD